MAIVPKLLAIVPLLAICPLVAICWADLRHRLIPDWAVLALAGIGLLGGLAACLPGPQPWLALQSALVAGGICAVIGVSLSLVGLWGWGDAKLLAAAGLLTSLSGLAPMFLAMAFTGGVLALLLLALRQPVRAGRWRLPASAPRWLQVEQRRLLLAPSVPYGLAIVVGLIAGM